jgi:hypothetical protein
MPNMCFSCPADVPPGTGTRDAVQPDPPQCHVVRRDRAFGVLCALADAGGRVAGRE